MQMKMPKQSSKARLRNKSSRLSPFKEIASSAHLQVKKSSIQLKAPSAEISSTTLPAPNGAFATETKELSALQLLAEVCGQSHHFSIGSSKRKRTREEDIDLSAEHRPEARSCFWPVKSSERAIANLRNCSIPGASVDDHSRSANFVEPWTRSQEPAIWDSFNNHIAAANYQNRLSNLASLENNVVDILQLMQIQHVDIAGNETSAESEDDAECQQQECHCPDVQSDTNTKRHLLNVYCHGNYLHLIDCRSGPIHQHLFPNMLQCDHREPFNLHTAVPEIDCGRCRAYHAATAPRLYRDSLWYREGRAETEEEKRRREREVTVSVRSEDECDVSSPSYEDQKRPLRNEKKSGGRFSKRIASQDTTLSTASSRAQTGSPTHSLDGDDDIRSIQPTQTPPPSKSSSPIAQNLTTTTTDPSTTRRTSRTTTDSAIKDPPKPNPFPFTSWSTFLIEERKSPPRTTTTTTIHRSPWQHGQATAAQDQECLERALKKFKRGKDAAGLPHQVRLQLYLDEISAGSRGEEEEKDPMGRKITMVGER